jgi:hypothetical protein
LATANFQEIDHAYLMFEYLKHVRQPGLPLMAMEFWTGWFDRWSEKHHLVDNARRYFKLFTNPLTDRITNVDMTFLSASVTNLL